MIKFEHVKTYNWLDAIRGMRNSWESWGKIDSHTVCGGEIYIGENDEKLMMKLVKAGSDHAKFLRQILISVDIIAPEYFWKEFDTYKVGTVANSTSMMHTLGRTEITEEMFSWEDTPEWAKKDYLALINDLRVRWINIGKKKPSPEWR